MQVRSISELPFPGWPRFREAINAISAGAALAYVQTIVKTLSEQQNGIFEGLAPIFPINLHVVVREWILLLTADEFLLHDRDDAEAVSILLKACREINALRQSHPALRNLIQLPDSMRYEQQLRKLWFHHLEQIGQSWAPKFELGRSQRMFVEIWTELLQSERIQVVGLHGNAFLDMPRRLLLVMGVWQCGGHVEDVRALLSNTPFTEAQISTLLEVSFPTLQSVQNQIQISAGYPTSIQNIFHRHPLLRVGDWGIIAPLPDLALQWWDLQNLFETLECTIANNNTSNGGAQFYRALGLVVEEYIRDLLHEMAEISGEISCVDPFYICSGHESPDGFLHQPHVGTVVFESKCYRVPQRNYESVTLQDFMEWFANLLGKNRNERAPLMQGFAFYEQWLASNQEILNKLPGSNPDRSIYVIVSYEDVPCFLQWKRFRLWYRDRLDKRTYALWDKTLVISVRDLEVLTAAGHVAGITGGPPSSFDPFRILSEYLEYRDSEIDLGGVDTTASVKDPLGSWILRCWPAVRASEPTTISTARTRLFESVEAAGFPISSLSAA